MSEGELRLYKDLVNAKRVSHIDFKLIAKKLYDELETQNTEIERLNNIINEFDSYVDDIIDERIEKIEGTRFLKGGFTIEQNYLRRRLHEKIQELKGVNKE